MSHYEVLGVAPTADDATIRRAYLALARRHHPDRVAGADGRRMAEINQAWSVLGDAASRARYDEELEAARRARRSEAPTWRPYDPGPEPDPMPPEDVASPTPARTAITLAPAALLVAAVVTGILGLVLGSLALLALGGLLGVATLASFVLAPVFTMYESYRDDPDRVGR